MPTHHKGSPDEKMALDLLIKFMRAHDSIHARLVPQLQHSGISVSQFGVLDALYHFGPLPLCALARKHLRTPNNMTSVVDTMERGGLVVRERQENDRRLVKVRLTPEGVHMFEEIFPLHVRLVSEIMGVLSPVEQEQLNGLLRKIGTGRTQLEA